MALLGFTLPPDSGGEAHLRSDHSTVADSIPEPRCRKYADHLGRCPSNRVVLQLHHVHGGEQRRSDSVGAEFSSQNARQIRDAIVD